MSTTGDRAVELHLQNPDWDYLRIAAALPCPAHRDDDPDGASGTFPMQSSIAYHVLALHRAGVRQAPPHRGRPGAGPVIGPLVVRLREENPGWTHARIAEEVRALVPDSKTSAESIPSFLHRASHGRRQ
jgi:hypothetical protein